MELRIEQPATEQANTPDLHYLNIGGLTDVEANALAAWNQEQADKSEILTREHQQRADAIHAALRIRTEGRES